jgi:hypothetical protein
MKFVKKMKIVVEVEVVIVEIIIHQQAQNGHVEADATKVVRYLF